MSSPIMTTITPDKIPLFHSLIQHYDIRQSQTRPIDCHHANVVRLRILKRLIDRHHRSANPIDDVMKKKILSRLKTLDIDNLLPRVRASKSPRKQIYLKNLEKIKKTLNIMAQLETKIITLFLSTIPIDDLLALYEESHKGTLRSRSGSKTRTSGNI